MGSGGLFYIPFRCSPLNADALLKFGGFRMRMRGEGVACVKRKLAHFLGNWPAWVPRRGLNLGIAVDLNRGCCNPPRAFSSSGFTTVGLVPPVRSAGASLARDMPPCSCSRKKPLRRLQPSARASNRCDRVSGWQRLLPRLYRGGKRRVARFLALELRKGDRGQKRKSGLW